ncbi:hypothetical protein [Bradyrhizobium sp. RDM4]|uniref:hypothetical protein n=1 Tax=Bradyrhizobium sp. RDM4 TaxID=3378765 RepID=UPI0038FBF5FB
MRRVRQKAAPGTGEGPVRAKVLWLDGACGAAPLATDGSSPIVLMIDGEPFVRVDLFGVSVEQGRAPLYLQVKPYRVDVSLLEGM